MADGHLMHASPHNIELSLSLDDAIAQLESGVTDGISVDLGNGRKAVAEGVRGAEGLLQRLLGHRMILALAAGGKGAQQHFALLETVTVSPEVQEILDAAAIKR